MLLGRQATKETTTSIAVDTAGRETNYIVQLPTQGLGLIESKGVRREIRGAFVVCWGFVVVVVTVAVVVAAAVADNDDDDVLVVVGEWLLLSWWWSSS